ncbi:hypothetical protein PC123_g3215 [Phytophthora cactorum]|nr:hypothetical protein PC120_g3076 [Phytophthora cactorum]KAG4061905.1 hypothetical protein PC123_g3215 [Phytophthora cactorum]
MILKIAYCEPKSMRVDKLTRTLPAPRLDELHELVMFVDQLAQSGKEY